MEPALKQRLIGAAVLVALAVIFLPMLIQGPAPQSGVSNVPLDAPPEPAGEYETRELPLVAPAAAPGGSVVGMEGAGDGAGVPDPDAADPAVVAPAAGSPPAAAPAADDAKVASQPLPAAETARSTPAADKAGPRLDAPVAGGNFAVNFGAFSTVAAADALVASLRASQLPGYREAASVGGKTVQRVRIGPYATRAQAEAARLRAAHVRDDVGARVVTLDAEVAPAPAKPAVARTTEAPKPAAPAPKPATAPAASSTGFAVQVGAFSKAADAAALRDRLRAAGFSAFTETVATDKATLTRVRVGPVLDRAEADQLRAQLKSTSGIDGIVRPHP